MRRRITFQLFMLLFGVALLGSWTQAFAESDAATPFYPTWKLLSTSEKQQFVAGYAQGWRDAARVTEIAIAYVKENPNKAVDGLEQIKRIYDLQDIKPALLAAAIDVFFELPENKNAGLSQAVSAARQAIAGK